VDPFGNGVGQMLALAKKEAMAGPPLPFGPMVAGSYKSAMSAIPPIGAKYGTAAK
jgi:hypothetical protein